MRKKLNAIVFYAVSCWLLIGGWHNVVAAQQRGEMRSKFANFEKLRVHYVETGTGRDALVFVHGWSCDSTFWRANLPAFNDLHVIAVDLPGHGKSDKPNNISYTMDLFARSLNAVLKDAKVTRAVLVGHSMGTPVIRQFYRKYPQTVSALVIVDGTLKPYAPRAAMEQFIAPLRGKDYNAAMVGMVDGMLAPVFDGKLREEIRAKMLAAPQHVAVSAMEGMAADEIWVNNQIKVPVLAILAQSPFWTADNEALFRSIAPDLEYNMWSDVSHFLMLEKPAEFNQTLRGFLTKRALLNKG